MSDHFAIQQVLNTYSYNASTGNLAAMVATFAPDGVWEVPGAGLNLSGHAAILAAADAAAVDDAVAVVEALADIVTGERG